MNFLSFVSDLHWLLAEYYQDGLDNAEPYFTGEVVHPEVDRRTRYVYLLASLAAQVREGDIVELGTFFGFGTLSLAYGASLGHQRPVHTFDVNPEFQERARRKVRRCGRHANFHNGTSYLLRQQGYQPEKIGLAYVDADHSHAWCLDDLENVLTRLLPLAKILVHDVYPPSGPDWKAEQNGPFTACQTFLEAHQDWNGSYLGDSFMLLSPQDAWRVDPTPVH